MREDTLAMSTSVHLEVHGLDELGREHGIVRLRAHGRAWSAVPVELRAPVLVAGSARVRSGAGAPGMHAGPDGPGWATHFRVPDSVAAAAGSWTVEADVGDQVPGTPVASPRLPPAATPQLPVVCTPLSDAGPILPRVRPRAEETAPLRDDALTAPARAELEQRLLHALDDLEHLNAAVPRLAARAAVLAEATATVRRQDAARVAASAARVHTERVRPPKASGPRQGAAALGLPVSSPPAARPAPPPAAVPPTAAPSSDAGRAARAARDRRFSLILGLLALVILLFLAVVVLSGRG